jgi:site-specific DNA recombinase
MEKTAAIYARVSSDRQKENHTIQSQTAALTEYAKAHGYAVPSQWQFQDEGYSGATLLRPGLEAVRDLTATGQIAAVLVYSPDRLSRKYAYQVLLAEEFARCGVQLVFLQAPSAATAEDQLLVQFQGMIAEYERAQIVERSRRGKRHRAQQGSINVLSGAPYGYRYIKKNDTSAAYYQVVETEAEVVRMIFDRYTHAGLSIGAITRELNQAQIPTRSGNGRWERSTVWGILRNPAYVGRACFGKTRLQPRQRITRRLRQRGILPARQSANHERPRQEWIEISVPALVTEETFALAQEQLQKNKQFASRRTIRPTLLQGLLVCQNCGYALYGSSGGRYPNHVRYYYRCLGSDGWRHLRGPVCQNRPVRQDHLDELVWREVLRLVQDPVLLQGEIDRRIREAKNADPVGQREQYLNREQSRVQNKIDRLLTAYQEELITLEQLRQRMPELRKQEKAVRSELESLHMAATDKARYLRVVDSLSKFRARLQGNAERLDFVGRRKIIRLLVREILIGRDTITIRHSIPPTNSPSTPTDPSSPSAGSGRSSDQRYRLCTRGNHRALRRTCFRFRPFAFLHHSSLQPFLDEPQDARISDAMLHELDHPTFVEVVEKAADVSVQNVVHFPLQECV